MNPVVGRDEKNRLLMVVGVRGSKTGRRGCDVVQFGGDDSSYLGDTKKYAGADYAGTCPLVWNVHGYEYDVYHSIYPVFYKYQNCYRFVLFW